MRVLLFFLVCSRCFATPESGEPLRLEPNQSETLSFGSISQATVSDGRVARLRQVNAHTLLLTARKAGKCTVRVWEHSGKAHEFPVHVIAPGKWDVSTDMGVVRVRVQILEVSEKAREQLGVHWPQMLDIQAMGALSSPPLVAEGGVRLGPLHGWLQQLMEKGWAKVLSQPDLVVALGEQASFSSGGELPFPVLTDSYGRLQQSIQWKNYGLSLKVRPESADKFVIRSEVQIEISDLSSGLGLQNVPALSKRTLNTKVNSKDGETIYLSGLIRNSASKNRGAVPGISSIPVLGILFQEHAEASENSEVLIAMNLSLKTSEDGRLHHERFQNLEKREAP